MTVSGRPDVIQMLEREKEYYLEQIKRINMALAALKGEVKQSDDDTPQTRRIEWTAEIMNVLDVFEGLDFDGVRKTLAERGIPEALEPRYRNTIYTTLKRKVDEGVLAKGATGVYLRKGGGASVGSDPPK